MGSAGRLLDLAPILLDIDKYERATTVKEKEEYFNELKKDIGTLLLELGLQEINPLFGALLFLNDYYENEPEMVKAVGDHLKKQAEDGDLRAKERYEEYLEKHTEPTKEELKLFFEQHPPAIKLFDKIYFVHY